MSDNSSVAKGCARNEKLIIFTTSGKSTLRLTSKVFMRPSSVMSQNQPEANFTTGSRDETEKTLTNFDKLMGLRNHPNHRRYLCTDFVRRQAESVENATNDSF